MEETMSDWSLLPFDVLPEIALKLDTVEDFVYFSVTCQAWNYASSLVKSKWRSKFPWLLLAEKTINENEDSTKTIRKLFSLNKNKCYEFELSPTFGARCWGSSCGWIVVFDINMQISLFNPFTQARILLPPQSTMPAQLEEDDSDEDIDKLHLFLRNAFITKAFVWKLMTNYDDLIIIAIHGNLKRALAFVRPGDQVWTSIITPADNGVVDIAYYGGQMFILYEDGALGYCNITEARSLQPLKAMDYLQAPRGTLDKIRRRIHSLYLVDSYGDLLMILRYKIDYVKGDEAYDHSDGDDEEEEYEEGYEPLFYKTTTFEVFRLNFERKEWERVEDIGDVTLFVGDNCSISVRGSDANNCKPNSIYFTDDECDYWAPDINVGRHDMRMYDMKTHKFESFYEGDDVRSNICTALWFSPCF